MIQSAASRTATINTPRASHRYSPERSSRPSRSRGTWSSILMLAAGQPSWRRWQTVAKPSEWTSARSRNSLRTQSAPSSPRLNWIRSKRGRPACRAASTYIGGPRCSVSTLSWVTTSTLTIHRAGDCGRELSKRLQVPSVLVLRAWSVFARCVVLRTARWALDGRSKLTHIDEFRTFLGDTAAEMVRGARELREAVKANGRQPVTVLNRSAAGLEEDDRLGTRAPRLVVTSPPYPGVHVLYHRWQVDGRKEAPLPFMIANKLDGAGSSRIQRHAQRLAFSRRVRSFSQLPRHRISRASYRRKMGSA